MSISPSFSPADNNWLSSLFSEPQDSVPIPQLVVRARERLGSITILLEWFNEYQKSLDRDLHQLIQANYHSFLELHDKNQNLYELIQHLKPELEDFKKHLTAISTKLSNEQNAIASRLQKSREISTKKQTLQIFLRLSAIITKIEKILSSSADDPTSPSPSPLPIPTADRDLASLVAQCNQMERVANEFNQVRYYFLEGKNYPFVISNTEIISGIEKNFSENLEKLIGEGFRRKNVQIVESCLRSYAVTNKQHVAETIFADTVVFPFLEKAIPSDNLNLSKRSIPEKGSLTEKSLPSDNLETIYAKIITWIEQECCYLFTLTHESHSLGGFNFLKNSIFPAIVELLQKYLGRIFSTGVPDVFYQNYVASMDFLGKIEFFFGNSVDLIHKFREHSAYKTFSKKWNILLYFQMRFREIAGNFEDQLEIPITITEDILKRYSDNKVERMEDHDFIFPSTQAVWEGVKQCWGAYYLHSLCHRFFKLALQIVRRYCHWLELKLETNFDSLPILSYTYVYYDIEILETKITHLLPKIITQNRQIENLNNDLMPSIVNSMVTMSTNSLQKINTKLGSCIIKRISDLTQNELQNIGIIPRAYRLTGKPVQNKPMPYVHNLITPINSYYSSYSKFINQEKWQNIWLKEILTNLIEKYIEMANQLLTSERKKEAIIRKVNKTQKGVSNTGTNSDMSDTDKMTLQLILDITHFGKALNSQLKINTQLFPPFQRIWELVSDSQHLLSTLQE